MTWWQLILVVWSSALAVSIVIGVYFGVKDKEIWTDGKEDDTVNSRRSLR